jgi:hypothetical protein
MGPKKGTYENPIGASLEQVQLLAAVRAARSRGRPPAPQPPVAEKPTTVPQKRHRHDTKKGCTGTEEAKPTKKAGLVGFPTWAAASAASASSTGEGVSAAAMGPLSPYLAGPAQAGPPACLEKDSQDQQEDDFGDFDEKCRELFDSPPRGPETARAPTTAKAAKQQTRKQVD